MKGRPLRRVAFETSASLDLRGKPAFYGIQATDMLEVPATEVVKRFARYRHAAQHEPVAVTPRSRVTEVLMSKRDYDEYLRLKSLATRSLWAEDLSEKMVSELGTARVDSRHDRLNTLPDD